MVRSARRAQVPHIAIPLQVQMCGRSCTLNRHAATGSAWHLKLRQLY